MHRGGPLKDLILFGKIISIALLSGGYIAMGVYIGIQLTKKGYPGWTTFAGAIVGTIAGILHGAWAIMDIVRKRG